MKTIYKIMMGISFMFLTISLCAQVEDTNTSNTREDTTTTATDSQREDTAERETLRIDMPADTITARDNDRLDEAREGDSDNTVDDGGLELITSLNESISESATSAIDIFHSVELVPQQTSMSCWAAAAAMVVGWKWSVCINPEEIASEIGFWDQYDSGLTFDNSEDFFQHWDLTIQPLQTFTVQGFAGILENGPIWVVTSGGMGGHAVVASAMRGDGTPDGTMLTIYDPWERGMESFRTSNRGAIYQQTYTEFVEQQEELVVRVIDLETIFMLAQ